MVGKIILLVVLIAINAFFVAAESFAGAMVALLIKLSLPFSENTLRLISVSVITIILSYFSLVFGELVPKRMAMNKSEAIAFAVVKPLVFMMKAAKPFVKLLNSSTNLVISLFGVDPHSIKEAWTI